MLGIIILNYNNAAQTLQCLDSLYSRCPEAGRKICVVDNASRQEDLEALRAGCKEKILVSGENRGYACGNNIGLEYFENDPDVDAVLILNNDTLFTEDILTPLYAYIRGHEECGVVFPLVKTPSGEIDKACWRRQKDTRDLVRQATSIGSGKPRGEFLPVSEIPDAEAVPTGVPPGSCMMLRKDVFKKLGYLDPHTFLYFEEHILSAKLKREGLSCVLMPRISIIHLGAQTTRTQAPKAIRRHWRNSYLYFMKNYSDVPAVLQQMLRFRTWLGLLR